MTPAHDDSRFNSERSNEQKRIKIQYVDITSCEYHSNSYSLP